MFRKLIYLVSFVLVLCMTADVHAELTGVLNPSFEDDWTGWYHRTSYTYTSAEGGDFAETPYGSNWAELGNGSWFYQQIGIWEEGMLLEVSFLVGSKIGQSFRGLYVSLWVGGEASLAANSGTKTPTTLESAVGATQIVISDLIIPPLGAGETSEQVVELSTGTGYTFGDPLWLLVQAQATTTRTCVDNVAVKIPATQLVWPSPSGVVDVPRNTDLKWTAPSNYTPSHYDVYFGTEPNELNPNFDMELIYTGTDTSFDPNKPGTTDPDLDFDTTYYWRVDAIDPNDVGPVTYEDSVWQFTVEPFAYPIAGDNIIATADSFNSADERPENTINSSGLDANDLHSVDSTAMWLSSAVDPNAAWIQYEFDRLYKLHEMLVWNHNTSTELVSGFGVKDATIEYSTDGANWTTLGTTHEFDQGPGTTGYATNTTVDLGGTAAKHIKITANSNWGGIFYGLSEVRFFNIPVSVREPSPDSEATDVDVNVTLGWRAGREAARHDVYLSTDEQAVIDGNAPVNTVTDASYSPLPLDLGSTYYWRIDEVNETETPTTWQGDIWSFSTQEYLVVDDFESYNEIPAGEEGSNLVYLTWTDGYVEPPEVRTNGSTMGHAVAYEPSMESVTVYDGVQSAPLYYDNTTADYSEATVNVANLQVGQDWTKHGVKALTLRFYGDPNNSVNEQMYVKLNGSKVTYDGDAENLKRIGWQMWYIDLADFGLDLSNVTELIIGFERGAGGTGKVLFDDIRLYPFERQLITPAEPNQAGLVAYFEFEGTYNDSSGNGLHGTAMGNPTFVAGMVGQAIHLRGLNDYVEITGYKGVVGDGSETPPWSVTAWVRTNGNGEVVGWGSTGNGNRMEFRINEGRTRAEGGGGATQGDTSINDGGWHHIAVTVQPNSVYSSGIDLWSDGQLDTRLNTDPDPWHPTANFDVKIGIRYNGSGREFTGEIDDVRIYNRVLTEEEIAWLSGRTKPFDKPF